MPSFSVTTAVLEITGGTSAFVPARFSEAKARLYIAGGSPAFAVGSDPTTSASSVPELDRLTSFDQLLNKDGTPSLRFMAIWQSVVTKIEEAFTVQSGDISDLETIVARLAAAEALAASAKTEATASTAASNITNSYTDPTNILSAANTGVVTIAAHERVYGDASRVSVNSGSVSGFASGNYVSVYYDDAARAGGAVTYQGTTNAVAQTGSRHVIGGVSVPAIGEPAATGTTVTAPGYVWKIDDVTLREYEP
ncbi:MAG: hypothetical protein NUV75_14395 [Gallionella sp.]|nr:hypothetical protein [Gallionella sp.]